MDFESLVESKIQLIEKRIAKLELNQKGENENKKNF